MSLAVVKEDVLTVSTDIWVPVQVPSWRFKSQSYFPVEDSSPSTSPSSESKSKICVKVTIEQLYSPTPKHLETHSCKETQTAIDSAETRRTQFSRINQNLKNKVTSDEY